MKFDDLDIQTVAKGRVSRAENKTTTYWTVGAIIAMGVGIVLTRYSTIASWILVLAGGVAYFYYISKLGKKQKAAQSALLSEWHAADKGVK